MARKSDPVVEPAGSEQDTFTIWSKQRGVAINAVHPSRISGRGLGITAQRQIKAGEELVSVPSAALLTEESVPSDFKETHRDITVHGLLASYLAFGGAKINSYAPWRATWPSMTDFRDCMPLLWPEGARAHLQSTDEAHEDLYSLLPPAIGSGQWVKESSACFGAWVSQGLLRQQEDRFLGDWAKVKVVFPKADRDTFLYSWLIVNTRSLYFELPGSKGTRLKADNVVLCPFVDLFNHADQGCNVAFDKTGYTVTADRAYAAGEEMFVSYGRHNNDFLLVEYGFVLEANKWDSLPLDHLLPQDIVINKARKKRLEDAGYFGNYTLTTEGVCYRTEVAIRTVTLGFQDWKKFLRGQPSTEHLRDCHDSRAKAYIAEHILLVYLFRANEALKALACLQNDDIRIQRDVLVKRWTQISELIQQAMDIQ